MTVFGTRPEAVKMAPIVTGLEADDRFEAITVLTAQHREMLDQVLQRFVGQALAIGPWRVAKNAGEQIGVGRLQLA